MLEKVIMWTIIAFLAGLGVLTCAAINARVAESRACEERGGKFECRVVAVVNGNSIDECECK